MLVYYLENELECDFIGEWEKEGWIQELFELFINNFLEK